MEVKSEDRGVPARYKGVQHLPRPPFDIFLDLSESLVPQQHQVSKPIINHEMLLHWYVLIFYPLSLLEGLDPGLTWWKGILDHIH